MIISTLNVIVFLIV